MGIWGTGEGRRLPPPQGVWKTLGKAGYNFKNQSINHLRHPLKHVLTFLSTFPSSRYSSASEGEMLAASFLSRSTFQLERERFPSASIGLDSSSLTYYFDAPLPRVRADGRSAPRATSGRAHPARQVPCPTYSCFPPLHSDLQPLPFAWVSSPTQACPATSTPSFISMHLNPELRCFPQTLNPSTPLIHVIWTPRTQESPSLMQCPLPTQAPGLSLTSGAPAAEPV